MTPELEYSGQKGYKRGKVFDQGFRLALPRVRLRRGPLVNEQTDRDRVEERPFVGGESLRVS